MRVRRSEDYYVRVLLQQTKVKDIMTSPVISVKVDVPFSQVEEKFQQHGIRHLPIVGDNNVLLGLITQRDLYRVLSPKKQEDGQTFYDREALDEIILARVMNDRPVSVQPEDSVGQAVLLMVKGKYGCLPVVEKNGQLCGIITQMDILKVSAEILQGG